MPRRSLSQGSFFDPEFVAPDCLVPGTVPWLLARFRSRLFPAWLLKGWRGEGKAGRDAWPAVVLTVLWMLRWTEEGMSRVASVKRAGNDAEWRAAMGLTFGIKPPSEKTMRDFEKFLLADHLEAGTPRYLLLHGHFVRLCVEEGVVGDDAIWATDSTPMWCYGAVLDTVRLLGDGLCMLGRRWVRATRTTVAKLASTWNLPLLLAKSTKGSYRVDWRNPDERAKVVDDLAHQVMRVAAWVQSHVGEARPAFHKGLLRQCHNLLRVVRDDLETDERGRLVIARKVARDRLVSMTDPQARHGRKSRSRTFNGFKLHVLGDLVSGVIAAVSVGPGNEHDGAPTPRLVRRAKMLIETIEKTLGDTAYAGSRLRDGVRKTLGVELVTPPPPDTQRKEGKAAKADFAIDFEADAVTCPNGITSTTYTEVRHSEYDLPTRRYEWSADVCGPCPLRPGCVGKARGGRRLLLHPFEAQLRAHRQSWDDPRVREEYRRRSEFERLVHEPVRHGARRARSFGLGAANLQAHAVVAVCNLRLLAQALVARERASERLALAA